MRMSPVVFADREQLKAIHDELVLAWEEGAQMEFDGALDKMRDIIATVPRKSCGSRKVYSKNTEQPAWVALKDPSVEDIECID